MLAIVAYVTAKDLILMALEQTYIFASLAIPYSTLSVEASAQDEVVLRIKLYSSDLSLMPF